MSNPRRERIEWLLRELEHEVCRGMMEREIGESMQFDFFVPISNEIPSGVVHCTFVTRPRPFHAIPAGYGAEPPKLRVVEGGKK